MDRETWEFINTFAPWAAALGTIAAVVVSLYLARETRVRVRVRASLSQLARIGGTPGRDGWPEVLCISVRNIGQRRATITQLGWETRSMWPLPKRNFFQVPGDHPLSARIPETLDDGGSADYFFALDRVRDSVGVHFRHRSVWIDRMHVKHTKVYATTSTGKVVRRAVDVRVRDLFLQMFDEAAARRGEGAGP